MSDGNNGNGKNGNGRNLLIPISVVLVMLGGAVGYGELKGSVSAAQNAIRALENREENWSKWRESVTDSLARLETAAGVRPSGRRSP